MDDLTPRERKVCDLLDRFCAQLTAEDLEDDEYSSRRPVNFDDAIDFIDDRLADDDEECCNDDERKWLEQEWDNGLQSAADRLADEAAYAANPMGYYGLSWRDFA